MMPLITELETLRGIGDYYPQASEKRKRKQALLKELRPKVQLWGVYMVMLVEEKKVYEFQTGFPNLMMYSLRRPASVNPAGTRSSLADAASFRKLSAPDLNLVSVRLRRA